MLLHSDLVPRQYMLQPGQTIAVKVLGRMRLVNHAWLAACTDRKLLKKVHLACEEEFEVDKMFKRAGNWLKDHFASVQVESFTITNQIHGQALRGLRVKQAFIRTHNLTEESLDSELSLIYAFEVCELLTVRITHNEAYNSDEKENRQANSTKLFRACAELLQTFEGHPRHTHEVHILLMKMNYMNDFHAVEEILWDLHAHLNVMVHVHFSLWSGYNLSGMRPTVEALKFDRYAFIGDNIEDTRDAVKSLQAKVRNRGCQISACIALTIT
jgi:hypothetical protein